MTKDIKVLVVNASPKGEYSLTLQHSLYMLGHEQDTQFRVLQVGESLSPIRFDPAWLESAIADVEWADAIIWTTPVYTMLVPWQLIRFFSLIKEAKRSTVFQGKYATSMMTCFHYYDHLAEDWLRAMSEDLGMFYLEGRTADNMDMLKKTHRSDMRYFMSVFVAACRERKPLERKFMPLPAVTSPLFSPLTTKHEIPLVEAQESSLKTVLLTDEFDEDGNLSRMIDVIIESYPYPIEIIDINKFPYEAGCHGCLKCELVGDCARQDGFQEFYFNLVRNSDVLLFGMNIEDRYLKPIWKLFLDRTFSNGHRTSMMGKHTGYLVAGPLRALPTVRQFIEGKDNVGRENAIFIIGDEYEDSAYLDDLLRFSARRLAEAADKKHQKSVNFLGIGGMKIFRDLIYGMRGVVRDDHRFYKKNRLYDFPQKKIPQEVFNLGMGMAFTLKSVRLQAYERMPELYIKLHKDIVESGKD